MKRTASTIAPVFVLGILFAYSFGHLVSTTTDAAAKSALVTVVPSEPFATGGTGVTPNTLFAVDKFVVPAGKRLIIEVVTIESNVTAGDRTSCAMTVVPAGGGDAVVHNFVMTPQGAAPGPFDVFKSHTPTRLYYQPGDELTWFCYRNGNGFLSFAWSISGSLVDP